MSRPMRARKVVASAVLEYCAKMEPDDVAFGDILAAELAAMAASALDQCPYCGAEEWVNIDCDVCLVASALLAGEVP